MSRSVRFKLSGDRLQAALKFSNDLGIDLNEAAYRSLFLCIRQAYSSSAQPTDEAPNVTALQADASGDTADTQSVPDSGATLAESASVDASAP